jgi:Ni/Fe-hydrogenase subunit HybB-like protein
MAGFVLPLIQAPTVQTGPQSANVGTFLQGLESYFPYFPSLTEWGVAAGLVAFALLLFTLGVRYLPLFPHPQQQAA